MCTAAQNEMEMLITSHLDCKFKNIIQEINTVLVKKKKKVIILIDDMQFAFL